MSQANMQLDERPRPGVQFKEALGRLTKNEQQQVLRGIQTAGLLAYLEREPLGNVTFGPLAASGRYSFPSRDVTLNAGRSQESYGEALVPGHTWSVSSAGRTAVAAMRVSLVHELGHHLLATGGPPVQELASAAFTRAEGRRITQYADENWVEYFCETFAAYAFHRAVLRRRDPDGYRMIEAVREVLKL